MIGNPLLLGGDPQYAVMTPTIIGGGYNNPPTLTNGNLTVTGTAGYPYSSLASVGLLAGKRHFEVRRIVLGDPGDSTGFGLTAVDRQWLAYLHAYDSATNYTRLVINGATAASASVPFDGTWGWRVDLTAKSVTVTRNGVVVFSNVSFSSAAAAYPCVFRYCTTAARAPSVETFCFGASAAWDYAPPADYDGWYLET